MSATDRRKIFPVLVSPIEKEMLTRLASASGLSRCAVVRELIVRETATRQLVHHEPATKAGDR